MFKILFFFTELLLFIYLQHTTAHIPQRKNVTIKASHPFAPKTHYTQPLPQFLSSPLSLFPPFPNSNDLTQLSLRNHTHTQCDTQVCFWWRLTSLVLNPVTVSPKSKTRCFFEHTCLNDLILNNILLVTFEGGYYSFCKSLCCKSCTNKQD